MAKSVLGSQNAIDQGTQKTWNFADGEMRTQVFRGLTLAVENLYESSKSLAAFDPYLDSLDFDPGHGIGTLITREVEDGKPIYELWSNDVYKPVQAHPYFADSLTSDQFLDVRKAMDESTSITTEDKAQELWELLNKGTVEYLESAYVLRETKNVSKRSVISASFTDVNRVSDPPDTAQVNHLIGSLPTGEWLKRSPQVRQFGARRWQITTEWWWGEKVSAILYGGTGTP